MAKVVSVQLNGKHTFTKQPTLFIELLEGQGVAGDAHCGVTVQSRYLKRLDPSAPNLRQVHLIQQEVIDDLNLQGFNISAGEMGENITTQDINLLALPLHTELHFADGATLKLTGIRTPCSQLNKYRKGLMKAVSKKEGEQAHFVCGVMAVVTKGGSVSTGEVISTTLPPTPHHALPAL
ncbi:MOSC domain-containing protein [Veronia nyctiphanis]|uniref:MOSC domain-containing protein n=1 Tax=Veronia nyctiphanis TaxID=1278244 RepID=A0A4Q0YLT3_9GAMM|nr:MOSC domain-containing protein [Veronia nyctiphanis]RXJ71740.1 MOSC domain-containing protein [Veronia nyctiphanis]